MSGPDRGCAHVACDSRALRPAADGGIVKLRSHLMHDKHPVRTKHYA